MLKYFDIYRNNTYVKSRNKSISYGEALSTINYYAQLIDQHATDPTVVFAVPNSIQAQLLMFAALQVRNVVLLRPELLEMSPAFYQQFEPCTILSFRPLPQVCKQLVLDPRQILENHSDNKATANVSTTLTLITSGTTGAAKLVTLQHKEIEGYGNQLTNYIEFDSSDCILNLLPVYHGFGLTRIITMVSTGGSQVIPETNTFKNIVSMINEHAVTWTSLVPSQVKLLNQLGGTLNSQFKFATTSAAHCNVDDIVQFEKTFNRPLLAEYGCTEASIISSSTADNNRIGSVGQVASNRVQIIDNEVCIVPEWSQIGQLVYTGDFGYLDSENFLWIQGRKKEAIKRNGVTLIPQELESFINRLPGVTESAVYVHTVDSRGDLLGLVYVGTSDEIQVIKTIFQASPNLARNIVKVTQVPELPMTFNKVRRLELKQYVSQLK
jgi:acyl-CoA synthetase (AMP-forming)/AMP-acid ligase II